MSILVMIEESPNTLRNLVDRANSLFDTILRDIPKLRGRAYLVYSSTMGQCNLTADYREVYHQFRQFFDTQDCTAELEHLSERILLLNKQRDSNQKLPSSSVSNRTGNLASPEPLKQSDPVEMKMRLANQQLMSRLSSLPIAGDVSVEFRFWELDYCLIQDLKNHPPVPQPPTKMRPAYIQVVLISRAQFEQSHSEQRKGK